MNDHHMSYCLSLDLSKYAHFLVAYISEIRPQTGLPSAGLVNYFLSPPSFLRELSIQLCHQIPCTASALSLLRLINGRKEKTEALSFGELNCQLYCIAGEQTP